ncbi:MAG: glycosyltransferase family 4 protein [Marinilabiliaceae bacterium]|nr:glycosyltransferase family 4 protein [Marinilabiliaceae bacterium]
MKRIKILQTIRQGQVGGGESHVLELVANMNQSVFEPVVLSFTDGPMVDALKRQGITVKVIRTEQPFNIGVWRQVTNLLRGENIDLVHAHGTRALSNVFSAAKQLDLPLIYTVHGWSFHPDQSFVIRQIRERAEQFLTRKADTTICVSKSNETDGINRLKMKHSQVIHNAINLDKFNPDRPLKDIRAEFGIQADDFVLGFIARITGQKDPFTLLRALRKLSKTNNRVRLLMVGDGDLKKQVIEKVEAWGLKHRIIFQPFRNDIPDILNAIDLYCLPSLWEGFPIGILEAMAMRKPVIATPVDGTRELITDKSTGFFVKTGDSEALAVKIWTLCRQPELREKVADKASHYVRSNFGIKKQVKQIESIYTTALLNGKNKNNTSFKSSISC